MHILYCESIFPSLIAWFFPLNIPFAPLYKTFLTLKPSSPPLWAHTHGEETACKGMCVDILHNSQGVEASQVYSDRLMGK